MQDLKPLAIQVENLSMAVTRYNDICHKIKYATGDSADDHKTLGQIIEMIQGFGREIETEIGKLSEAPRIVPDQVEADTNFKGALEASLSGWRCEHELIQKELIDQALIDSKAGEKSNRYKALEKRDKDLSRMIADAEAEAWKCY
jgi:hypothetical protein